MTGALAKRREIMLGLLVVVLGATLWKNIGGLVGGVTGGGDGTPGRGPRPELAGLKLYPIDWASLDAPRPSYDQNGRNIFQFGVIPPPPPPVLTKAEQEAIKKAQKQAEEERTRQEELQRQQMLQDAARKSEEMAAARELELHPPPPPPPPKPQPPPISYKFIGYFGPANAKVAVLSDGQETLFVRQGEELPKGIKVLEIGYESIKFGFTDPQFKDESRTLPMSSSY